MKIFAYESVGVGPGVEALAIQEHKVSLRGVLKDRLVSLTDGSELESRIDGAALSTVRFGVRRPRKRYVEYSGFLAYTHDDALADFLSGPFVPPKGSRIDGLLGSCRSRDERRKRVLDLLSRKCGSRPWQFPGPVAKSGILDFVIRHRDLENLPLRGGCDNRAHFGGGFEGCVVSAERVLRYAGRRIPRVVSAWAGPNMPAGTVSWYDGERFGHAESTDKIPPALYEELDARGRARAVDGPQPLPYPALAPVALVRIPSRKEAVKAASAAAPFDRPLYLIDTRDPVPIPEGLPVVEDVEAALAVAARAPDGIFVPGDLPSTGLALTEEPKWCLATAFGA